MARGAVLVASNDTARRALITKSLRELGCAVIQDRAALEAARHLSPHGSGARSAPIDAVLIDAGTQQDRGLVLLEAVRRLDQGLPILLLLSGDQRVDREEATRLGASNVIGLPAEADAVADALLAVMSSTAQD